MKTLRELFFGKKNIKNSKKQQFRKAVKADSLEMVKTLVETGANVNWRYRGGMNDANERNYYRPLDLARSEAMKIFLLEHGAKSDSEIMREYCDALDAIRLKESGICIE